MGVDKVWHLKKSFLRKLNAGKKMFRNPGEETLQHLPLREKAGCRVPSRGVQEDNWASSHRMKVGKQERLQCYILSNCRTLFNPTLGMRNWQTCKQTMLGTGPEATFNNYGQRLISKGIIYFKN